MKFILQLIVTLIAFTSVLADKKTKLQQVEKELRQNFEKSLGKQKTIDDPDIYPVLEPETDLHSNYQFDQGKAKILNYNVDMELDFETETISGTVVITAESLQPLPEMHLDIWNMEVLDNKSVFITIPDYDKPLDNVKLDMVEVDAQLNKFYGGAITMNFMKQIESFERDKDGKIKEPQTLKAGPILADTLFYLTIKFKTINDHNLDVPVRYSFVKAENTHGKKAPFFYTQNTPIYARTLFPCWDTPQSQTQLHMKIKVKKELGLSIYTHYPLESQEDEGDFTVGTLKQEFPLVATHQIAIVAGKLQQKQIDDRIFLLADDGETLKKAAEEFDQLPIWINETEQLIGMNYVWDRFEMIIMPPNYPYEGNQQQQLTYISPSVINAGRTGKAVVLHEIASNYFGNYIQACNWQNAWMNEGISTYLERVTKSLVFGDLYNDIDKIIGNYTLFETFEFLDEIKADESFKSLHPAALRHNPDDAITEVTFEKGYQFIAYIQQLIGERKTLNLLKDLIETYRFKTVDYKIFDAFCKVWLEVNMDTIKDGEDIYEQIDFEAWSTKPGQPPKDTIKHFTSTENDIVESMANKFLQFDGSARPQSYKDVLTWNEDMQYAFLDFFQRHAYKVNVRLIKQLDELYNFKNSKDQEILFRWFSMSTLHRFNHVDNTQLLDKFMRQVGRIKFVVPIYESFAKSGQTEKADFYLLELAEFYHPVALEAIESAIFRATMDI